MVFLRTSNFAIGISLIRILILNLTGIHKKYHVSLFGRVNELTNSSDERTNRPMKIKTPTFPVFYYSMV